MFEFREAGCSEDQARVNLAFAAMLENQLDLAAYQLQLAAASGNSATMERAVSLRRVIDRSRSQQSNTTRELGYASHSGSQTMMR